DAIVVEIVEERPGAPGIDMERARLVGADRNVRKAVAIKVEVAVRRELAELLVVERAGVFPQQIAGASRVDIDAALRPERAAVSQRIDRKVRSSIAVSISEQI